MRKTNKEFSQVLGELLIQIKIQKLLKIKM